MRGLGAVHLARRFFSSIRPGRPAPDDAAWAWAHLTPGEQALWTQMSNPDQRHAIGVARGVVDELGLETVRAVVAAALMHDVGKIECGYRTPARVVATIVWKVVPHDRAVGWLDGPRPLRRLAEYRRHPEIGEQLLIEAGAAPLTSAWAGDHHKSSARWRGPSEVVQALWRNDND